MGLAGAAAIALGGAIAKGIVKLWLKDQHVARMVGVGLIDLLKDKTKDLLAREKGEVHFKAIGLKVAESLLPVFKHEGGDLDEGGRAAVAHAVAQTLEETPISTELLAEQNLEPTRLAAHLKVNHQRFTKSFSQSETALYERIMDESSQHIVDIASDLPGFLESSFAEVLKRLDQFLPKLDEILQVTRGMYETSQKANPEVAAARFERDYRAAIVRRLNRVELYGVDLSGTNRRQDLSVAYVSLSVEQDLRPEGAEELSVNGRLPGKGDDDEEEDEDDGRTVAAVEEALSRSDHLLIRGPAGCGKTTLLQWIAVRSAKGDFPEGLMDWSESIPVFIQLRRYVKQDLPKPEEMPAAVAPAISGDMPDGWVHEQLRARRAILLVDGVDEIDAARREEVRTWLDDLLKSHPGNRVVVTSRPYAVDEGWLSAEGFGDAELQTMEWGDICTFVEHWHEAVGKELEDQEQRDQLTPLAEGLKKELRRTRALRRLAETPLLCALLCALNRQRHEQLPKDRIQLYEACCQMLLERREKERQVVLKEYPELSYRQMRALLEDFAYWLVRNGLTEVERGQADERCSAKLANMTDVPKATTGADVRRLFVERAALLQEPVEGWINFRHRTFEEFLAAQAIADEADFGLLLEHADDGQWREVIILAAGLAKKRATEIIGPLIERGDAQKSRRHHYHLLAVACLETAVELPEDVRTAVQNRLSKLVPPRNVTEAKAVASAGELALPFLGAEADRKVAVAAACVRALSIIGGEGALAALEQYGDDPRVGVGVELVRAWDSFDRTGFARRILSRFPVADGRLRIPRTSSLEGIQVLRDPLRHLDLSGSRQLSDLGPLSGLTGLREVYLYHTKVSDLRPLSRLTGLQSVDLSYTQVSDLSPLSGLTGLQALHLGGTRVTDLSPLSGLTGLQRLKVWNTKVSDLTPLSGLTGLQTLLVGSTQVTDLGPLSGLTGLQALGLSDTEVSDLTPLAGLTGLQTLNLDGTEVTELRPLLGLTGLQTLHLARTKVTDLRPLSGLTSLQTLKVWNTGVCDLTALAGLTGLQTLDLDGTEVTELRPLLGLTALQTLHLARTKVTDLRPLSGLTGLQTLGLSDTEVSDLTPLSGLTGLQTLSVKRTKVTDLGPLSGLTGLQRLYLRGTKVTDLGPLSGLTGLKWLDLTDTQVTDLTPVEHLPNLHITGGPKRRGRE